MCTLAHTNFIARATQCSTAAAAVLSLSLAAARELRTVLGACALCAAPDARRGAQLMGFFNGARARASLSPFLSHVYTIEVYICIGASAQCPRAAVQYSPYLRRASARARICGARVDPGKEEAHVGRSGAVCVYVSVYIPGTAFSLACSLGSVFRERAPVAERGTRATSLL